MIDQIGRPRFIRHLFVAVLILLALLLPLSLPNAYAATKPIDPREIALTPGDLPAGFSVDPGSTGLSILPDSAGVSYRIDMKRAPTPDTVADGPIIVQQIIVRLDAPVSANEVLASVRDELIEDAGMSLTGDGPNDGGTVSLKRTEGDVILYSIGFVKEQMVIFTTSGGLGSVTTLPKLRELAGISSSRLDASLARP
jgi:hypothetical protein